LNYSPEIAFEIITAVVIKCSAIEMHLKRVRVDSHLAEALDINDGDRISGLTTVFAAEHKLGRQVIFER
jgi:hypothetical protein